MGNKKSGSSVEISPPQLMPQKPTATVRKGKPSEEKKKEPKQKEGKSEEIPRDPKSYNISTVAIVGDRDKEKSKDVAPPLHVSTTFEVPNEDQLSYSRSDAMTRRRAEALLGALETGVISNEALEYAILYGSGIAAVVAVMVLFQPKKVAIAKGYAGSTAAMRTVNERVQLVDLDEELTNEKEGKSSMEAGDVYFVETPSNPRCIMYDIEEISQIATSKGAYLVVDSTFATPILQNPLELGADIVMHSCTKYLGGHSDLLGGALITKNLSFLRKLHSQRLNLGSPLGSLECWLLLRSLRTLKMRVQKQSKNAKKVAIFLSKHPKVTKVWHPSLESHPSYELCKKQMKMPPSCFSFELATPEKAYNFPDLLEIIRNATSLGGIESLIDYRYKHDSSVSPNLLRISIGIESAKDLQADLEQALERS
eukprot:TRINITY_DN633_c0_g1_i4.p1 TRINITY_DN633_c0_g1~~TRINITY_DN633_c0_g1_i4.p1  ORF type:complete len:424 (-),score=117.24 TRINITY_DN633_c0_g1_i4:1-1272(-)